MALETTKTEDNAKFDELFRDNRNALLASIQLFENKINLCYAKEVSFESENDNQYEPHTLVVLERASQKSNDIEHSPITKNDVNILLQEIDKVAKFEAVDGHAIYSNLGDADYDRLQRAWGQLENKSDFEDMSEEKLVKSLLLNVENEAMKNVNVVIREDSKEEQCVMEIVDENHYKRTIKSKIGMMLAPLRFVENGSIEFANKENKMDSSLVKWAFENMPSALASKLHVNETAECVKNASPNIKQWVKENSETSLGIKSFASLINILEEEEKKKFLDNRLSINARKIRIRRIPAREGKDEMTMDNR